MPMLCELSSLLTYSSFCLFVLRISSLNIFHIMLQTSNSCLFFFIISSPNTQFLSEDITYRRCQNVLLTTHSVLDTFKSPKRHQNINIKVEYVQSSSSSLEIKFLYELMRGSNKKCQCVVLLVIHSSIEQVESSSLNEKKSSHNR